MRPRTLSGSLLLTLPLAPLVSTLGHIEVHNFCDRKIHQSLVLGSTPTTAGFVPSKDVREYAYGPIADGLSIKFGYNTEHVEANPLQFEVTRNYSMDGQEQVYYDFSSLDGNPFVKHRRAIVPSDSKCQSIICPKNKRICNEGSYYRGQHPSYNPVSMCHSDADLAVYLCSLGPR